MYTIRKQFAFEAAHHLEGLEPDHPCMRPHGHSYRVEIVLQGELMENDFVLDYRALDALKQHIDGDFDHRDLNEVLKMPTTAENLAKYFFDWCKERWPEVASASVSETQKTWASYSEP